MQSQLQSQSQSLPPLLIVSEGPLTQSLLLNLSRINPGSGKVVLFCLEHDALVARVPRHIDVVTEPKPLLERVKSFSSDAVVVVFRDNDSLLLVPEAIPVAATCARTNPHRVFGFVDATGRHEILGVTFIAMRHWGLALSPCRSFACTVGLLTSLKDWIDMFWDAPAHIAWAALDSLTNTRVMCPLPSLAAPLPVTDASPPGVNWKQLEEFVSKS